jgi:lipoate-protein ligase A
MALDEALLELMPRLGRPILRLYGWTEAAASFGYFQKYGEIEELTRLRPLVRRPTGGGLVPHAADWTYSLVFPVTDEWYSLTASESYRRVHEWLQSAFAKLNLPTELAPVARKAHPGRCFEGYERFDLLWRGRKIAGAALRRRRDGLLIQGSIQPPALQLSKQVWEQALYSTALPGRELQWEDLVNGRELNTRAAELATQKYSQASYNQRR